MTTDGTDNTDVRGSQRDCAGYLDRDGKLDLLFDLRENELGTQLALYHSSAAKEGALVGRIAEWHAYSNC